MRTCLTAAEPVASPLPGGAEKVCSPRLPTPPSPTQPPHSPSPLDVPPQVIELSPLSDLNTARLLCRLSPRTLRLHELPGAANASDFVQLLARHPLVARLGGNPGRVKATVPRLQTLSQAEGNRLQELSSCDTYLDTLKREEKVRARWP